MGLIYQYQKKEVEWTPFETKTYKVTPKKVIHYLTKWGINPDATPATIQIYHVIKI